MHTGPICGVSTVLVAFLLIGLVSVVLYYTGIVTSFGYYSSKSLPYPSKIFVGREQEMSKLSSLLDFHSETDIRIVNIVGSPGFGKSTLAIHLGDYMVKHGIVVHYVNMAEYHEQQDIHTILSEKILKAADYASQKFTLETLQKWLRKIFWNSLIIIDDCDDLLQSKKEPFFNAMQKIVELTPRIKILITSREVTTRLEYFERYPVYELSTRAACELLETKLPSSNTNITASEIEEIAKLTGNVPLALQIIGALLMSTTALSPSVIIRELRSRPIQLLSHEEIPPSHRINVSISLSYRYLNPEMRKISRYLANFPGSFDYTAAYAIFAKLQDDLHSDSELDNNLITDTLKNLVFRSLIEFDTRAQRYKFHRLIKEYFKEAHKALTVSESIDFTARFQTYYSSLLLKTVRLFESDYQRALLSLNNERHNYQMILESLKIKNHELGPFLSIIFAISQALQKNRLLSLYFTEDEIISPMQSAIEYIEDHQLLTVFSNSTSIEGMSYEIFRLVYVTLAYESIKIEKKLIGAEAAKLTYEKRKSYLQFVMTDASISRQPTDQVLYEMLAKLHDELGNYEDSKFWHTYVLLNDIKDITNRCRVGKRYGVARHLCSFRLLGEAYLAVGQYEMSTQLLESSYEHEENQGIAKLFLLYDMINVYTRLKQLDKAEKFANELHLLIEDDSLVSISELYNFKSTLLEYISVLKSLNQTTVASLLEVKVVEAVAMVESQTRSCFQSQGTLEIMKFYFEQKTYKKTIQLGQALLNNQILCTKYGRLKETFNLDAVAIKAKTMIAKAIFESGNFSQGMDEMEKLIAIVLPVQTLYKNQFSDICIYLIPRLRYINSCYPWVVSIPKYILYITLVIPLDPYSSNSEVLISLPQSTFPELIRLSKSKEVIQLKEFEVGKQIPFFDAKHVIFDYALWAWSIGSSLICFLLKFPLICFFVNTLSVLLRLYLLIATFGVIIIFFLWLELFLLGGTAIILLFLMLKFPKFVLSPPLISLACFLFSCHKFVSTHFVIPLNRVAEYILLLKYIAKRRYTPSLIISIRL